MSGIAGPFQASKFEPVSLVDSDQFSMNLKSKGGTFKGSVSFSSPKDLSFSSIQESGQLSFKYTDAAGEKQSLKLRIGKKTPLYALLEKNAADQSLSNDLILRNLTLLLDVKAASGKAVKSVRVQFKDGKAQSISRGDEQFRGTYQTKRGLVNKEEQRDLISQFTHLSSDKKFEKMRKKIPEGIAASGSAGRSADQVERDAEVKRTAEALRSKEVDCRDREEVKSSPEDRFLKELEKKIGQAKAIRVETGQGLPDAFDVTDLNSGSPGGEFAKGLRDLIKGFSGDMDTDLSRFDDFVDNHSFPDRQFNHAKYSAKLAFREVFGLRPSYERLEAHIERQGVSTIKQARVKAFILKTALDAARKYGIDKLPIIMTRAQELPVDFEQAVSGEPMNLLDPRKGDLPAGPSDPKRNPRSQFIVSFANQFLGGGVLQDQKGSLQEEIKAMKTPQEMALLAGNPGARPVVREGPAVGGKATPIVMLDCHQTVEMDSSLYKSEGFEGADEAKLSSLVREMKPVRYNKLAMAAPDLKKTPAIKPTASVVIDDMFVTAFRGFTQVRKVNRGKDKPLVHTGILGCGDFGNDIRVAVLTQLLAAKQAGVDLQFHGIRGKDGHVEAQYEEAKKIWIDLSLRLNSGSMTIQQALEEIGKRLNS